MASRYASGFELVVSWTPLDGRQNLKNLFCMIYRVLIFSLISFTDLRISMRLGFSGVMMNFKPLPRAIISMLESGLTDMFLTYRLYLFAFSFRLRVIEWLRIADWSLWCLWFLSLGLDAF